jgi:hypothetical protein
MAGPQITAAATQSTFESRRFAPQIGQARAARLGVLPQTSQTR